MCLPSSYCVDFCAIFLYFDLLRVQLYISGEEKKKLMFRTSAPAG
jgi:hypothetical protein